ncbi:MAG: tRNA/rRNA methyltransferase [Bacteroidetes bacterium]|nr:tRNA/rRNA methyltransferase [Bacteroidota bacterium]
MNYRFILVEPKVPENIGSAARAVKVTGTGNIALVNPLCPLDGKALWVAHGSEELIKEARCFSTLAEALVETDFSVATSAKARRVRQNPVCVSYLKQFVESRYSGEATVAIVFGREESGLTNDEINQCDLTSFIPMKQPYPSLNLAQAVLVYAYELTKLSTDLNAKGIVNDHHTGLRNDPPLHLLKERVSVLLHHTALPDDRALFGRIMERIGLLSPSDQRLMLSAATRIIELVETRKS